jgi:2-keto-4-pentenoate hydratase/2-oxohepta-3-ene-1,7-dioic acid hydratase in catechol pathway
MACAPPIRAAYRRTAANAEPRVSAPQGLENCMKLASYRVRDRDSFGVVVGEGVIDLMFRLQTRCAGVLELLRAEGGLDDARAAARGVRPDFPLAEVELLPPLRNPEKILCVGINYANRHVESGDAEPPRYPSLFFRTPASLVGSGELIVLPHESEQFDYEGEIALVIGRAGRRIPRAQALDHVAGVTLCNEGSVRDWMRHGKFNVTQGKNFDASGSIGPWIVTADEIDLTLPLHIMARLNGVVTQDATTLSLIKSFPELIAYASTFMTLRPGDVIVTGTPAKLGRSSGEPVWLKPGDLVEIEVPEIGILRNTVVAEQ